jgi:DMSO/TMAO reductase YedYZ molybdopterin-dependent catalytic subunit
MRTATSAAARWAALFLVMLPLVGQPAAAQSGSDGSGSNAIAVDVEGAVQHRLHLTAQDIEGMPAERVSASYVTGHGQEKADYVGVLLWTLLDRAQLNQESRRRDHLRETVTVTGRDGYAVIFSMGELDPDFEGKSVILAYQRSDQPLPVAEGLRLVVPGDKHGGRCVRDVVRIEVR